MKITIYNSANDIYHGNLSKTSTINRENSHNSNSYGLNSFKRTKELQNAGKKVKKAGFAVAIWHAIKVFLGLEEDFNKGKKTRYDYRPEQKSSSAQPQVNKDRGGQNAVSKPVETQRASVQNPLTKLEIAKQNYNRSRLSSIENNFRATIMYADNEINSIKPYIQRAKNTAISGHERMPIIIDGELDVYTVKYNKDSDTISIDDNIAEVTFDATNGEVKRFQSYDDWNRELNYTPDTIMLSYRMNNSDITVTAEKHDTEHPTQCRIIHKDSDEKIVSDETTYFKYNEGVLVEEDIVDNLKAIHKIKDYTTPNVNTRYETETEVEIDTNASNRYAVKNKTTGEIISVNLDEIKHFIDNADEFYDEQIGILDDKIMKNPDDYDMVADKDAIKEEEFVYLFQDYLDAATDSDDFFTDEEMKILNYEDVSAKEKYNLMIKKGYKPFDRIFIKDKQGRLVKELVQNSNNTEVTANYYIYDDTGKLILSNPKNPDVNYTVILPSGITVTSAIAKKGILDPYEYEDTDFHYYVTLDGRTYDYESCRDSNLLIGNYTIEK